MALDGINIQKLINSLSTDKAKSIVNQIVSETGINEDGLITSDELSIFLPKVKEYFGKNKGICLEDQIIIQSAGKPIGEEPVVSEKKAKRQAEREDKKEFKSAVETIDTYLQDIADHNITREDLIKELEVRINLQKDDKRYVALMQQGVENILAVVNEMELNSPYEVDNNITAAKIRKALKEKGLETEGTKALLADNVKIQVNLRKMVKTELQEKAKADITAVYAEVVAEQKAAGKKVVMDDEVIHGELGKDDVVVTDAEILKEVKKRLADKMSNGSGHKHDYQNSYDRAFEAYVNNEAMMSARRIVLHAFDGQLGLKEGQMTREVRQNLKDSGVWDKYIKKAYNHEMGGRAIAKDQALENNLAVKRYQSKEELKKAVGDVIFEALVSQGLITEDSYGLYDIKELQDLIRTQVGGDKTLSAAADVNEKIAEKLRTNSKLVMNTKLSEISDKEVKKLVKACGFDVDGPQWGKALLALLGGATVGAVAGGGSAYTNPTQVFHKDPDKIFHNLNLNVNIAGDFDLGTLTGLPEGAEIAKTGTGVSIKISQLIETGGFFAVASKFVGLTALKTGLIGAAIGLVEGLVTLSPKGEKAVIPTSYPEENFEEYIQRVILENEKTPHIAEIATAIATSFKNENGEWDKVAYAKFLNTAGAGDGSPLNKAELLGALRARLNELKNTPVEEPKKEEAKQEEPKYDAELTKKATEIEETVDNTYTHDRKYGDSWAGIVTAYYPDLVEKYGLYGKNGAIRKLKIALATDENGQINQKEYSSLLNASDLPKQMKLPSEIDGVKRVIGEVKGVKISKPENGKYIKPLDEVGRDEKVTVKKIGPGVYTARDTENNTTTSGSTAAEAMDRLEATTKRKYENRDEIIANVDKNN